MAMISAIREVANKIFLDILEVRIHKAHRMIHNRTGI